jgi:cytochrome c5|tara:strand:+ start:1110 stop:1616 length:507 start_codon:yes stop_codon:yes gene_type:complete
MKIILKSSAVLFSVLMMSCGGKEEKKKEGFSVDRAKTTTEQPAPEPVATDVKPSETVDLTNKGVGPITSLTLSAEVDQEMAKKGEGIYNQMCLACHRVDKKFIGPAPKGVLERRSPEWVMNMILNPEVMVKEDPLAKALLAEFNGAPMANQGLTEEQARAVLEYFRTL